MGTTAKARLTRKEAALVLQENGFPIEAITLSRLANKHRGPPFTRFMSRTVIYDRDELLAWARRQTIRFEGE